jgi:serine/threonine protein kinase
VETGQIVGGKYRLRKKIGEGGMGSVWSAVHDTLDRTVAIKFLQPAGADSDSAAARFVAEAKSAARVKHLFVIDVFDFGISELGEYYMVQELLEGEELADSLQHGAAWAASDVVRFICQCLTGLEAVHQAGIIHRDLKPENIFVMRNAEGRYPKLLDFGISKTSEPAHPRSSSTADTRSARPRQLTMHGATVGTPWYMSPEQLRGRRDLDARADLYSMGVILYEWLTGRVPYAEDNLAELALQIAAGAAPPLVSLRPELGHELSSVLARAMAPEPSGRFASASEMREALMAVIPALPRAWSVVQKGGSKAVKPGPQATGLKSAGRGAHTEALLAAAEQSFGKSQRLRLLSLHPRLRKPLLAVGSTILLALVTLPWLREARPERANAHGASRPLAAPQAVARPSAAPTHLPASASAEPDVERDVPEQQAASAAVGATAPKAVSRRSEARQRSQQPGAEPERKATRRAQRTLIHDLDF